MNNQLQTTNTQTQKPSALAVMASRLSVEPGKMLETLRGTCFKGATDAEMLALVVVANEYGLNPFLRELYAFPKKGGGIVPVVGIDGWTRIATRHPDFDGVSFDFTIEEDGKPVSCTAKMGIKGRTRPVEVTEYYDECYRDTDPWRTMPKRMLRHRAFIQAARLAFGISGIVDDEEAHAIIDVTPQPQPEPAPEPARRGRQPGSKNKVNVEFQDEAPAPAQTNSRPATKQEEIASICGQNNITIDEFNSWATHEGMIPAEAPTWDEIPNENAVRIMRIPNAMIDAIKALKGGAQ